MPGLCRESEVDVSGLWGVCLLWRNPEKRQGGGGSMTTQPATIIHSHIGAASGFPEVFREAIREVATLQGKLP